MTVVPALCQVSVLAYVCLEQSRYIEKTRNKFMSSFWKTGLAVFLSLSVRAHFSCRQILIIFKMTQVSPGGSLEVHAQSSVCKSLWSPSRVLTRMISCVVILYRLSLQSTTKTWWRGSLGYNRTVNWPTSVESRQNCINTACEIWPNEMI